MPDERDQLFQTKDLLIFTPIVASSLAITWQVGKFWRVGGFYFFSFSEHLVAASANLPLAIIVVLGVAGLIGMAAAFGKVSEYRPSAILQYVLIILFAAGIGAAHQMKWADDGLTIALSLIALSYALNSMLLRYSLASVVGMCWCFGSLILLTFTAAVDLYDVSLRNADKDKAKIAVVTTKLGSVSGLLLMAGDKGVLLYQPELKRITFQRLEEIRSVDWTYSR